MKRFDLITPEGTRDLLFGECAAVKAVESRLLGMFRARGYSEVVTPGLEFYDVFDLKSRYFPQESMYKLVDNKARLMVVRPDSTMPIARMAATRLRGEALPIKLCYCQSVYRNRPGMRGRSDEIRQTGIELIGSSSKRADIEMLTNALDTLSSFRTGGFRLELGHIGYFKALIDKIGCDQDTTENIRSLIEYKNYPALGDMLSEMGDTNAIKALKQLPKLFGGIEVFDRAAELAGDSDAAMSALSELRSVYEKLSAIGYDGTITIDLGLVNRMDYYTGIVVKGYIEGCGDAVLSGGRYDRLLSEFGFDAPATGFAVNVDAVARTEMRSHDYSDSPADVIVFGEDGFEIKAAEHTRKLISQGTKAEYAVFDTKEETLEYAKRKNIRRIDTVGEKVTEEIVNE